MHRHNLVIHESNLPRGQGWSPMTWQILEGEQKIPITLFEANSELDAGFIYLQDVIELNGTELIDEWHLVQAQATVALSLKWFDIYKHVVKSSRAQEGNKSVYNRRKPADSELDPIKSLADQFNFLRVVDNDRYPVFFE